MQLTREKIVLNNGVLMPKLAFGTWFMKDDTEVAKAVQTAIILGYLHIDTAQAYGNEKGIGDGIKAANIRRENLFITSKVDSELKDYHSTITSIDQTLVNMNLDYLDLMLIQDPQPWSKILDSNNRFFEENLDVWRALEDSVSSGKIRSAGVSDFTKVDLENIIENSKLIPSVNQLVVSIGNLPDVLINYDHKRGIVTEAYSVVPHGIVLKHPEIQIIANKYQTTVSQLCQRFVWQLGLPFWRKSASEQHIRQNIDLNFNISNNDMSLLSNLN